MSASGLGHVKTKSDFVVMPSGRQILAFFALRVTVEPKILGAVIPRRGFTQPGSKAEATTLHGDVSFTTQKQTSLSAKPHVRLVPATRRRRAPTLFVGKPLANVKNVKEVNARPAGESSLANCVCPVGLAWDSMLT
jgi:hypothetical protein